MVSDAHQSLALKIPSFAGCNAPSLPSYSLLQYRVGKTDQRATNHEFSASGEASIEGSAFAMFHLDYLSCFLTVLATILLARKSWIGLLLAIVNSLIVCVIGLRTSQLGFIPANLFCICVYAFSMRPWFKEHTPKSRSGAAAGIAGHIYT